MFASAGDDGTVRLWEGILWRDSGDSRDLTSRVCRLVGGNLTKAELDAFVPGLAGRATCPG